MKEKVYTNMKDIEKDFFPKHRVVKTKIPSPFEEDEWFIHENTDAGKCPYCKEKMVKHIIKEGARYHVTSYYKGKNGALSHCSNPCCEHNHGPGHCVPYNSNPNHELLFEVRMRKIFKVED
jgi:hypothetical protein